ncbi:30S ribosomal protein S4 [Candidatus Burarchaeum australiense]|nr:30S ribosomal protein S4 [Candidatus Burarchaeum australiense]
MGDPRRLKRKYDVPKRIWNTERITEEQALKGEYGLKNMRELWGAKKVLRKIRHEARRMLSLGEQGKLESQNLVKSTVRLGYTKEGATLDGLLSLSMRDILERRLQTRVVKLGLAKSVKQARQLIVHGFIAINGQKTSAPGYVVPMAEEKGIAYYRPIDLTVPEPKAKEAKRHGSTAAQLAPASPGVVPSPGA